MFDAIDMSHLIYFMIRKKRFILLFSQKNKKQTLVFFHMKSSTIDIILKKKGSKEGQCKNPKQHVNTEYLFFFLSIVWDFFSVYMYKSRCTHTLTHTLTLARIERCLANIKNKMYIDT